MAIVVERPLNTPHPVTGMVTITEKTLFTFESEGGSADVFFNGAEVATLNKNHPTYEANVAGEYTITINGKCTAAIVHADPIICCDGGGGGGGGTNVPLTQNCNDEESALSYDPCVESAVNDVQTSVDAVTTAVNNVQTSVDATTTAVENLEISGGTGPVGPNCNGDDASLVFDTCVNDSVQSVETAVDNAATAIVDAMPSDPTQIPTGANCNNLESVFTYDECVRDSVDAVTTAVSSADANNTTAITSVVTTLTERLIQAQNCNNDTALLMSDPCIEAAVNSASTAIVNAINSLNATNDGKRLVCASTDGRLLLLDISTNPPTLTELDGSAVADGATAEDCGGGGGADVPTGSDCNGNAAALTFDACVEAAVNTAATTIQTAVDAVTTAVQTADTNNTNAITQQTTDLVTNENAIVRGVAPQCYVGDNGEFFGHALTDNLGVLTGWHVISGTAPTDINSVTCPDVVPSQLHVQEVCLDVNGDGTEYRTAQSREVVSLVDLSIIAGPNYSFSDGTAVPGAAVVTDECNCPCECEIAEAVSRVLAAPLDPFTGIAALTITNTDLSDGSPVPDGECARVEVYTRPLDTTAWTLFETITGITGDPVSNYVSDNPTQSILNDMPPADILISGAAAPVAVDFNKENWATVTTNLNGAAAVELDIRSFVGGDCAGSTSSVYQFESTNSDNTDIVCVMRHLTADNDNKLDNVTQGAPSNASQSSMIASIFDPNGLPNGSWIESFGQANTFSNRTESDAIAILNNLCFEADGVTPIPVLRPTEHEDNLNNFFITEVNFSNGSSQITNSQITNGGGINITGTEMGNALNATNLFTGFRVNIYGSTHPLSGVYGDCVSRVDAWFGVSYCSDTPAITTFLMERDDPNLLLSDGVTQMNPQKSFFRYEFVPLTSENYQEFLYEKAESMYFA